LSQQSGRLKDMIRNFDPDTGEEVEFTTDMQLLTEIKDYCEEN
jgi:hypothetical protein